MEPTLINGRLGMGDMRSIPIAKLIIIMVGLPARGKSYITRKLARYLNWLQFETKVFNVGERRRAAGAQRSGEGIAGNCHTADFFDSHNKEAVAQRDDIALATLRELLSWLRHDHGSVAIFDATNSTISRRRMIYNTIRSHTEDGTEVLFLESRCSDSIVLERNMRLKLLGPDYKDTDVTRALADFRTRVKMYESSYEALGLYEEQLGLPYLTLFDVGRKLTIFNTSGLLTTQVIEFLVNFHLVERQIWMTRNGESEDDRTGRIGQHSPLSSAGQQYAHDMARFVSQQQLRWQTNNGCSSSQRRSKFKIWTSMMIQAVQTAQTFPIAEYIVRNLPLLNDLHAGAMAGLTFKEIKSWYPKEIEERKANPVSYRWPGPGGESHLDVIGRLRAIILELERTKDGVLLVTHRAVMRVLLSYFQGLSRDDLTQVEVPLHTLYLVEPHPYGVSVKVYRYDTASQWFYEIQS